MTWLALFLLAGSSLHFDLTDSRGRQVSGVSVEAGNMDADGWYQLTLVRSSKSKARHVLIWPFDGEAKVQDGPGEIPAIVIEPADVRALSNPRVTAALATPVVLNLVTLEQRAGSVGFDPEALKQAISKLADSKDAFERGVSHLFAGQVAEAVGPLSDAFRQRQRQLTRVPSEIYPVAMLYGKALMLSGKFADAAVAYLIALRQRPSDEWALKARSEALQQAGKAAADPRA